MTPERYHQIRHLFEAALEKPAEGHTVWLEAACEGDIDLRAEVQRLLVVDNLSGGLLEQTALLSAEPASGGRLEGRRVGAYQVLRQIGHGGMGAVYLAHRADEAYRKRVALKVVRHEFGGSEALRRFQQEREILAALDHPNIAHLLDGGTTEDGLPFFIMEYVEGKPITEYCDEHRLSVTERVRLFREVCGAVSYAHQNLVVHRDLKPSNILVTEQRSVKLLDFGIAKLLAAARDDETTAFLTRSGSRLMTPEYASPEQFKGEGITTSTDVYSLAVILYELLTGYRPYRMRSRLLHEVERIICEEEPIRPSAVVTCGNEASPDDRDRKTTSPEEVSELREGKPGKLSKRLSGDLDNILLMALRKEPQRRYYSVEQFSEDLERHLAGLPVRAQKDRPAYVAGKFVRRHRVAVFAAAAVVLVLLGGIATTSWQARLAHVARKHAEQQRQLAELQTREAESQRQAAIRERLLADARGQEVNAEKLSLERRFNDVRNLANSLFEIHRSLADIPGTVGARKVIVATALEYLDKLAKEAGQDVSLQDELAAGYEQLGNVQRHDTEAILKGSSDAILSYQKALRLHAWLEQKRPHRSDNPRAVRRLKESVIGALIEWVTTFQSQPDIRQRVERFRPLFAISVPWVYLEPTNRSLRSMAEQLSYDTCLAAERVSDPAASSALFQDSTAALDRLRLTNPWFSLAPLRLANCFRRAAMRLNHEGNLTGALAQYERSLYLLRQIHWEPAAQLSVNRELAAADLGNATLYEHFANDETVALADRKRHWSAAIDAYRELLDLGLDGGDDIMPPDSREKLAVHIEECKKLLAQLDFAPPVQ